MKGSQKILLVVVLLGLSIATALTFADTKPYEVKFEIYPDIDTVTLDITITNLQDFPDTLDMATILNEANYDVSNVNFKFFEWDTNTMNNHTETNVCNPYVESTLANGTDIINQNCTLVIYDLNYTVWDWKPRTLLTTSKDGTTDIRNQWDNVPIQKAGQVKATKKFRLVFDTPLVKTDEGWGSAGTVWLDLNGVLYVDKTHSSWYNVSWNYRKPITLTENNNTAWDRYQLNISVDTDALVTAGKLQADCDDLRFTDASGNALLYYIDAPAGACDTTNTQIWVRFTNVGAGTDTTYYMYYGNDGASAGSNNDTFEFFESFEAGVTGKWDVDTGSGYDTSGSEARTGSVGLTSDDTQNVISIDDMTGATNVKYAVWVYDTHVPGDTNFNEYITANLIGSSQDWLDIRQDGGLHAIAEVGYYDGSWGSTGVSRTEDTWMHWAFAYDGFKDHWYINGVNVKNTTRTGSMDFRLTMRTPAAWAGQSWDDVMVTKWVFNQPTYTLGAEEGKPITVSLVSPTNTTYEYDVSGTNITISYLLENPDTCWFINVTGSNISLPSCVNTTMKVGVGSYTGLQVWANDSAGNLDMANVNFSVRDTTAPAVTISSPTNTTYEYDPDGNNITVSYTVNDTAGISTCYYIDPDSNNITYASCQNTTLNVGKGLHSIQVYAIDNNGMVGSGNLSFTVRDTTAPYLEIVLPLNTSYVNIPLQYLVNDTSGIDIIKYRINAGSYTEITGNLTSIGSLGFNSIELVANDTDGNSVMKAINATKKTAGLELKVYDENTYTMLDNISIVMTNSTTALNYTNMLLNGSTEFFIDYENVTNGVTTITVSKYGYSTRNFYVEFSNATRTYLDAYLIETLNGIWVRWHISNTQAQAIVGARLQAQKLVGSDYIVVEEALSDTSGTASTYLDPTLTYQINVTKEGYETLIFNKQPTNNDIYITLVNSSLAVNFSYIFDDLFMAVLPQANSIVNGTNTTINYTIVSFNCTLNYYGMNITLTNGTQLFSNQQNNSCGSTVVGSFDSTALNLTTNGTINVTVWFYRAGYDGFETSYLYYIQATTDGLNFLKNINISMFAKSIVSLFITIFACIGISRYTQGLGVGAFGVVCLGVATYLGWFDPIIFMLVIFIIFSVYVLRNL